MTRSDRRQATVPNPRANTVSDEVRGLIFDCDGTLVDSMPVHFAAWQETMERHGIEFPEGRFYELGGVPTDKIVHLLASEAGVALAVGAVSQEKEDAFARQLSTVGVQPIEEVVAIAREHRGRLPMAVATGSLLEIAEQSLRQIGVLDWFETVVAAEHVTAHKPAPDVFLEAARRLGVEPDKCRAYEDTELGLQAIRRAGMHAVDIRPLR